MQVGTTDHEKRWFVSLTDIPQNVHGGSLFLVDEVVNISKQEQTGHAVKHEIFALFANLKPWAWL